MSQENVELAYVMYEALQRDDIEDFVRHLHPQVEWRSLVLEMEGPTTGHEGARQWWQSIREAFPDWYPSILEVRDLGEWVVVRAHVKGSGEGSGVGIDEDFWQVVRVVDGKIVSYAAFRTEAEALEAVGLRE